MKFLTRMIFLLLSISTTSAFAEDGLIRFERGYNELALKTQKENFLYRMSPQEIANAWDTTQSRKLINDIQNRINNVSGATNSNREASDAFEAKLAYQQKFVKPLVAQLFKLPYAQINLGLLVLLHDYLLNDVKRVAAKMVLDEITVTHFSQEELDRLAKERDVAHQAVQGANYGGAATIGILALLGVRKAGPGALKGLLSIFERAPEIREQVANSARKKVNQIREMTVEEALRIMRNAGVRFADDVSSRVVDVVTHHNKTALLKQAARNVGKSALFQNIVFVLGGNALGATGNVGWNALNRVMTTDSRNNGVFNPETVRHDYYDGLTVLRLHCKTKELVRTTAWLTTKSPSETMKLQLQGLYHELLNNYADFSYLMDTTRRFDVPTPLPRNVTVNPTDGKVSFALNIRGKTATESFSCDILRGVHANPVEVSLGEVLDEITTSFINLEAVFLKLYPPAS